MMATMMTTMTTAAAVATTMCELGNGDDGDDDVTACDSRPIRSATSYGDYSTMLAVGSLESGSRTLLTCRPRPGTPFEYSAIATSRSRLIEFEFANRQRRPSAHA